LMVESRATTSAVFTQCLAQDELLGAGRRWLRGRSSRRARAGARPDHTYGSKAPF
jgi:hypothetical protein